MMNDSDEQQRLFLVGYEAGQRFLGAVEAGTITAEEAQSNVPIGVGLLMSGPTTEFIIGRIFESATRDAFDDIVTKDAAGLPHPVEDWVQDDKLRSSIASRLYLKANCEIISLQN